MNADTFLGFLRGSGHTVLLDAGLVRVRPALPPDQAAILKELKPQIVEILNCGSRMGGGTVCDTISKNIENTAIVSQNRVGGSRIEKPMLATQLAKTQEKQQLCRKVGVTPSKTYSRLELATDCLGKLIPDEQARRKIRALAEADAKGWRFAGTATYQHILAGTIMDQIEKTSGKLICFIGSLEPDRFGGWYTKDTVKNG